MDEQLHISTIKKRQAKALSRVIQEVARIIIDSIVFDPFKKANRFSACLINSLVLR
jgi:hypothetical protein